MNETQSRKLSVPMVAMAVAVAAAMGFGAARLLPGRAAAPVAAATPTPAAAKDSGAAEAAPEVPIPAEYLAVAKIAVEPVASGGLNAEILSAGTVEALPNSSAQVVARAAGNVTRIQRRLGDKVRAGEVLANVESQEAASMAADRSVAAARVDLARKAFERESNLFKQGVTPRQEMEAAQAALAVAESEARRANAVASAARVARDGKSIAVVSPIDGTVTSESVTLGAFVQPQTELFQVAGKGPVQIESAISASDVGRIKAGDTAVILPASGQQVAATVRSVTPTVSGAARAATVVLEPAPGAALVVGEGVQVRLHVKQDGAGMIVPEDAVQNIEGRDVLFVRTKNGFRPQPVLVGPRSRGMAQIVSGVDAGTLVATRNAFLVKADMIKNAEEE